MKRAACGLLLALAAGCSGSGPEQPKDDPARGIYNYDHARELGIRVDPLPAEDELCPPDPATATERCTIDPRTTIIVLGYSVEAVRKAGSAFEKGKLICGGIAPSIPAIGDAQDHDRFARRRLRNAYGIDASDSLAELVAGCRTTSWGASMLLPD
jgi:hypothetical protein